MMPLVDESDWEYEYSETETEDFYIPVDLANVPDGSDPDKHAYKGGALPVLAQSKLRVLYASRKQAKSANATAAEGSSDATDELQILGLHSEEPLIMYQGRLLSCQWSAVIGTDLIFAKPDPRDGTSHTPLRNLPAIDLLAASSLKLVARPASIRPRDNVVDSIKLDEQESGHQVPGDEKSLLDDATVSQPDPSSFLARFNEAKLSRDDQSVLMISKSSNGSRVVAKARQSRPTNQASEDVTMSGI